MGNEDLINLLNEKFANKEISLDQYNQMLEKIKLSDPESRMKYISELKFLGDDFTKDGKYEEAIHFYDKILQIDPSHSVVIKNKAIALKYQGKDDEANIWYNKYQNLVKEKKKKQKILSYSIFILILAFIIGAIIFVPPAIHVPFYNPGDVVDNNDLDPNSVFVILNKTNNVYNVVIAKSEGDYWTWKNYTPFSIQCYDFDRRYNKKIESVYQNKYSFGDIVTNSTLGNDVGILILESHFGQYLVVPVIKNQKYNLWLWTVENTYNSLGKDFDINYPTLLLHLNPNDRVLGQVQPKYRPGDILDHKSSDRQAGWTTIITFHPETDEYEINTVYKNPDGSWGRFLNADTSRIDRTYVENQYPTKLDHVDLSQISVGFPGSTIQNSSTIIPVIPLYRSGDMIQKHLNDTTYDKDRALVVLRINENGMYLIGQIYFDPGEKVWYKNGDELPKEAFVSGVERNYPVLVKNINWDSTPTKHVVTDPDGHSYLTWVTPIGGTAGPTVAQVTGVQINIIYPRKWIGAIGYDGNIKSVEGTGTKTFNLPSYSKIISVNAQKQDGGSSIMRVEILKDGRVKATESTTAAYGVVMTSTIL